MKLSGAEIIAETLLEQIPEVYDAYKTNPDLAVIPLPASSGSTGFGLHGIDRAVERAVGANILK